MLIGKNDARAVVREGQAAVVERHVARFGDGARREFLAGAGRAGDQGRELAHARVERAPVAAHVVGEDRLPDRGAQARRGHANCR